MQQPIIGYQLDEEQAWVANTKSIKLFPTQRELKGLEARH
tara:strand:- start:17 stop:136 length:120 start_codon:yes stop_codon:yes gene_type:complete